MSQDSLFEKQYSLDDLTKKVDELKQKIVADDYRYYVLAEPSISDREYDSVFKELQDIEHAYPELQTQDSPTKRVGGQPLKEFKQFKHIIPMLSLSNTYTNQELSDFDRKELRRKNNLPENAFIIGLDIDKKPDTDDIFNGLTKWTMKIY